MSSRAFTPSADPHSNVPDSPGARLDRVETAIRSLGAEVRRLERLGLSRPAAECRRQLRYWQFLRAVLVLEPKLSPSRREAA